MISGGAQLGGGEVAGSACGVAARPRQAIAEKGATIVIVLTVMRAVSWGEKANAEAGVPGERARQS